MNTTDLNYNIGKIPLNDLKWSSGIAYIAIPSDGNRDSYIYQCFVKGTVSIKNKEGGVYHNCPIDKSKFNDLIFPEKWQDNGSPVIYVTEPIQQQPMVIGVCKFDNEIIDQQENQFKLQKIYNESLVEISGSAEHGSLTFIVDGTTQSSLDIVLLNKDNLAHMNTSVDGSYMLSTLRDIFIKSDTGVYFNSGTEEVASSIAIESINIRVYTPKFTINEGNEQMVLGNKLKLFLDDFIDELANTTVATSIGTQPLINSTQVRSFKNRTEELLSVISYTD